MLQIEDNFQVKSSGSLEARRNANKSVAVSHGEKGDFFFWQWKADGAGEETEFKCILLDGIGLQTRN